MFNTQLRMCCLLATLLICAISLSLYSSALNENPAGSLDCFTTPHIECPPDLVISPGNGIDPTWTGFPEVTIDSIGCPDPIVTFTDQVDTLDICHYRITRTWTATNPEDENLYDVCIQTIETIDNEPPLIINCPEDVTVYTNTFDCESYINWAPPQFLDDSDIISIELTGTRDGVPFNAEAEGYYPEGIHIITYRVEDACEYVSFCQFEINVMCARCHLICPDEACVATDADISPDVLGFAESWEGNENCGEATIDYEDIIMETGCMGTMIIYRVWTAVFETMPDYDYSCSQRIELKDDTDVQIFNCPPDITVDHNFIPVHWEQPNAVNGSYVVTLTSNYSPGNYFPVGITTVVYDAIDECGNTASCSFTVTVYNDMTYDDCPDDLVIECTGSGEAYITWDVPEYDGDCDKCLEGDRISGFMFIGSMNNKKYYCSRKNYTWEEARALAAKKGGKLATINSQEENDFLAASIITRTAFIGLSDADNEGHFVWDSGDPVTYTNWFPGQPNNSKGKQDYVEIMNTGAWNDVDNNESLEFIMEIPCDYVKQLKGPKVDTYVKPGDYNVVYRISDGCGLDKYCSFDIHINKGVSISCPDDIHINLPESEDEVIVNWEEPTTSTCCHKCKEDNTEPCVFVTQLKGPASGSAFPNYSHTLIKYKAKDWCDNHSHCHFYVNIHKVPDNSGKGGTTTYGLSGYGNEDFSFAFRQMQNGGLKHNSLNIYPNPASEKLFIKDQKAGLQSAIKIYATDGRIVHTLGKGDDISNGITINHLESGMYILHIDYTDGSQAVEHVFVK